MLTRINASPEQIEKIYFKHLKCKVLNLEYSYDDDDDIGFVSCYSLLNGLINFQFRKKKPCFFSIRPGGNSISYDISYPEGKLLERLTEIGLKAEKNFWDGGQI